MNLQKYSFGVGDRFAQQGRAQLEAVMAAGDMGIDVIPVWNKSYREHSTIGTEPMDVRKEADQAVKLKNYKGSYYVDADHINMSNVDMFIEASDFFTLDVADYIGQKAPQDQIDSFVQKYRNLTGTVEIKGIKRPLDISKELIDQIASKTLLAVNQAGELYRYIESRKGKNNFITEISMDETELPQSPVEMLFILAAISDQKIPAQTIAPKFTGRFNKGVDYIGDLSRFEREFNDDLAVIEFAVNNFDLPDNLKLSIHSGSDKFCLYPTMNKAIKRFGAGLHVKTAGTTWLEELIGLAEADGEGLEIAKEIYALAYERRQQLCRPYATVIDIKNENLPSPGDVKSWQSWRYAAALRHDQGCEHYNHDFRQLLHVGYKVAAEMGPRYLETIKNCSNVVAPNVTENILERHIKPIFF